MSSFYGKYKGLLLFVFIYWAICFVLLLLNDDSFIYAALSWNLLLGILPLLFIKKAEQNIKQKKVSWSTLWIMLWLFFFPNSVYIITDFIHIANDQFMWYVDAGKYSPDSGYVYSHEIFVWTKLLVIGTGFLCSLLAGLESLYIVERNIRRKFSMMICSLTLLIVSLLTGIGVYIGRFLRFNSWDIVFNPGQLLKQVINFDKFAVQFIVVFSIYVMGSYTLYKIFRKQSGIGG